MADMHVAVRVVRALVENELLAALAEAFGDPPVALRHLLADPFDAPDGVGIVDVDQEDSRPDLDGLLLNIGNPDEMTVGTLARRLIDLAGSSQQIVHTPARSGDPQRRCPDITRMNERYGWRPRVPLDEGLRRTLDWFTTTRVKDAVAAGGLS